MVNPLDNSVTVPGGDNIELRINGVTVSLNEVMALNPSDITKIEYHDNPGFRYNNAGAVIDYITRKRESGGNISVYLSNAPFIGYNENSFKTNDLIPYL